jgi:hypothetical protein
MSIAPGVRLGTYEVIGLIGSGGMGLKILPEECRSDPDRVARFDRETYVPVAPISPRSPGC